MKKQTNEDLFKFSIDKKIPFEPTHRIFLIEKIIKKLSISEFKDNVFYDYFDLESIKNNKNYFAKNFRIFSLSDDFYIGELEKISNEVLVEFELKNYIDINVDYDNFSISFFLTNPIIDKTKKNELIKIVIINSSKENNLWLSKYIYETTINTNKIDIQIKSLEYEMVNYINNLSKRFDLNSIINCYKILKSNLINITNLKIFLHKKSNNIANKVINKISKYKNKYKIDDDELLNNGISEKYLSVLNEISDFLTQFIKNKKLNKFTKILFSLLFSSLAISLASGTVVSVLHLTSNGKENRAKKLSSKYQYIPKEILKNIDYNIDDDSLKVINDKYKIIFDFQDEINDNKIPINFIDNSYIEKFNSLIKLKYIDPVLLDDVISLISPTKNNIFYEIKDRLNNEFIDILNLNNSYSSKLKIIIENILDNIELYQLPELYIKYKELKQKTENIRFTLNLELQNIKFLKLYSSNSLSYYYNSINDNLEIDDIEIKKFREELIKEQIQNYINYFNKEDFFPLIVERLKYFKNNYKDTVAQNMQWFITKDNKFTLNPDSKENIKWRLPYINHNILINENYIKEWLKSYDEWLWLINDDEKIGEINLENVKAFNHYKDFKNEFIANEFKDYENFNINVIDWKYWFPNYVIDYDKKISKEIFEHVSKIYGNNWEEHNSKTHKYWITQNYKLPINFDFDLFWTYGHIKTSETISRPITYEFLTEQPNYFSDFYQNPLSSLKLKNEFIYKETDINNIYDFPGVDKLTKTKYGSIDFDNYEDRETTRSQFVQWRKNWERLLSKFISKNWNQKQIILAISYYITSNVIYMYSNYEESFNTDGNDFCNPASLFETDRTLQCYGYSQNLSLALTLLNIPVRTVGGTMFSDIQNPLVSSGEHAWNEVFIDNKWVSVDLTFADYQEGWSDFNSELNLEEIFLDRDSGSRTMFRLDYPSYITTIIKYLNKDENGNYVHNYIELPTHYSTDPETELKWENMLPLLRKQYKTNQY